MILQLAYMDTYQEPLLRGLLGREFRRPLNDAAIAEAHKRWCRAQPIATVPHESASTIVMGVNHGRWIATCPECRAGLGALRHSERAHCFSCGAVFPVVWPEPLDEDRIVRLLLARPPIHRNWEPTETIDVLVADNLAHGHTV